MHMLRSYVQSPTTSDCSYAFWQRYYQTFPWAQGFASNQRKKENKLNAGTESYHRDHLLSKLLIVKDEEYEVRSNQARDGQILASNSGLQMQDDTLLWLSPILWEFLIYIEDPLFSEYPLLPLLELEDSGILVKDSWSGRGNQALSCVGHSLKHNKCSLLHTDLSSDSSSLFGLSGASLHNMHLILHNFLVFYFGMSQLQSFFLFGFVF